MFLFVELPVTSLHGDHASSCFPRRIEASSQAMTTRLVQAPLAEMVGICSWHIRNR